MASGNLNIVIDIIPTITIEFSIGGKVFGKINGLDKDDLICIKQQIQGRIIENTQESKDGTN